MKKCPDPSVLEAFATGDLLDDVASNVEEHALKCRRCAKALGDHAIHHDLVERVRDAAVARDSLLHLLNRLDEVENHLTTTVFGSCHNQIKGD